MRSHRRQALGGPGVPLRNPNRTQLGIATGHSNHGPDKLWTEYENHAAAARTRAILTSLAGRAHSHATARSPANHNGDDGIDVSDPTSILMSNVADHNGDLGIDAVAGVTDRGANKASANGNPAQCVNVACS